MKCDFVGWPCKLGFRLKVPGLHVFDCDSSQHRRARDGRYIDSPTFRRLSEAHYNVTLNVSDSCNRRIFQFREGIRYDRLRLTNTETRREQR